MNAGLSMVSTGFILPAAECDFKLDTIDKGHFSTAFLAGSCVGPIVWGSLSNSKGRKWVLITSLFLQGIADSLQAFVSNYWAILGLKFISGIAVTGQLFTVITYMSEFIPLKQRKSLVSFIEFFWISGHALASVSGLAIIPLRIEIRKDFFFFRSWNLYILVSSLPAILIGSWLTFFPETPKYLAEMGLKEKLLHVLVYMYEQNSDKPREEYIRKLMNSGESSLIGLIDQSHEDARNLNGKTISDVGISHESERVESVLKPPILKNTFFSCVFAFSLGFAYFALYLWLPEIFQRFADFEAQNKNERSNFCTVSRTVHSPVSTMNQVEEPFGCSRPVDTSIFINNIYLCVFCAPAILPMTFLVNRLGFKLLLVFHCLLCSVIIVGIYFTSSSFENLILLCLYISLVSVCMTGSFAYFATIFPTNLRSTGVTLTSFSSRVGGVIGNIVSSYLIDHYCLHLIIVVALQLVVAAITTMLIRD